MRVIPLLDADQVSCWSANYIVESINNFSPTAERPFVLGLPTGNTPLKMYRQLITLYQKKQISFQHVVTFNMDEYVGLPAHHPQSYYQFMQQKFFQHIDIPPENTHFLNGMTQDIPAECQRFESLIRHYGKVNLFIGGVGHDGHIAFNEPGSSLASRTRIKTLTEGTRQANAHFFNNDLQAVPKQALTVGIGTLLDAEQIMVLITGDSKALALQAAIEGSVNHLWTISCLQLHANAIIVCDAPATQELKVKTLNYFQDIEVNNLLG